MDPFTIIVSTLTVLELTIKVSEKTVRLLTNGKNLSNELIAVSNDVTDFRLVLVAVEKAAVEERRLMATLNSGLDSPTLAVEGITPAATTAAPDMIQRAHDKLLEICEYVRKLQNIRDAKGLAMVGRIRLLERSRLKTLREELQGMKGNISSYFAVRSRHVEKLSDELKWVTKAD